MPSGYPPSRNNVGFSEIVAYDLTYFRKYKYENTFVGPFSEHSYLTKLRF